MKFDMAQMKPPIIVGSDWNTAINDLSDYVFDTDLVKYRSREEQIFLGDLLTRFLRRPFQRTRSALATSPVTC
jgi:hypothetical protein